MAAELMATPRDTLTELPLPILVTPYDMARATRLNYHHHQHPKHDIDLGFITANDPSRPARGKDVSEMDDNEQALWLEGKAVRNSRGQLLPEYLHDRYHDIFCGPELAHTRSEKFTKAVLGCGGVLPRQAIDLSRKGEYKVVELSDKQYRFMSGFKRLYFVGAHDNPRFEAIKRDRIGRFFAEYAIEQSAQQLISEPLIDAFLHTQDRTLRKELCRQILEAAIDESVASLVSIHEEAQKEGMLRRRGAHVGNVVRRFFIPSRYGDYQRMLRQTLEATMAA